MSVFPFFRVIGFTGEPDAHNISQRQHGRETALIALPFNEFQADLSFAATNRLGVVHPGWYVATVYAVKLRHNIFLAMRTIHSFPGFLWIISPWLPCLRTSNQLPLRHFVTRRILRPEIGTLALPIRNRPGSASVPNSRWP
jgi:hypothetical protein